MGHRPEVGAGVADVDLSGKTAVVSGATDGIGRETALALGRLGARVVVHGRDPQKGHGVVDRLGRYRGEGEFVGADFSSFDAVREFADRIDERVGAVDMLVNNAGGVFKRGTLTADGVERTMAVNHFAPFLLTHRLLSLVPCDGRIVTVSSAAHHQASRRDLDRNAVTSIDGYDATRAYARSKLANILFTRELARRVGALVNTLHPGLVPGTGLWRDAPAWMRVSIAALALVPNPLLRVMADTPATGAETPVYLAAANLDTTGQYFVNCEPRQPSRAARNDGLARELWALSEQVTGMG